MLECIRKGWLSYYHRLIPTLKIRVVGDNPKVARRLESRGRTDRSFGEITTTRNEDEVMAKLALPHELKASFRVPRQQAERLVSKFKTGISFPGLLPDALKSSDAGIDSESGEGFEDATIWVPFQNRDTAQIEWHSELSTREVRLVPNGFPN